MLRKTTVTPYKLIWFLLAGLVLVLLAADTRAEDHLNLAGTVKNTQGKGIKDVAVKVTVNGQPLQPLGKEGDIRTGAWGSFAAEFTLPAGTLPGAEVKIQASKPAWRASGPIQAKLLAGGVDGAGNQLFYTHQNLGLERQVTPAFWLATLILLLVYLIIALEWLHRTLAALLGATLMLFISYTLGVYDSAYFILSFEDAMHAMDMNVVFLLLGMMIIVGVIKKTGMFQWLAYKSYALARGNVFVLAVLFMWITAVISAFLDNVTTMLLMIPVTIEIALTLKINPITFLIPEVFASNVGGTATLIGDPPNILIGSYANLTFGQFAVNLTGICTICMIITAVYYVFWYKKDYLQAEVKDVQATIASLREEYRITDRKLLALCLWLLGLTIFLFIIHGMLHMQPSVAALTGAMLLLVFSRVDIVEMLEHEVEWPTLVFFMALFIVIAGAEETGLIQIIAKWVKECLPGLPHGGHHHGPVGVRHRLGLHRQHPLHRHHASHCRFPEPDHTRRRQRRPVVVPGPGGLPGRQRHHDRGVGQRGDCGHDGKGRLPDFFPELHEGLLCAHAHHGHPLHDLLAGGLLRKAVRCP